MGQNKYTVTSFFGDRHKQNALQQKNCVTKATLDLRLAYYTSSQKEGHQRWVISYWPEIILRDISVYIQNIV